MERREGFPTASRDGDRHTAEWQGRKLDVYRLIHETRDLPVEQIPLGPVFASVVDQMFWNDADGRSVTVAEVLRAVVRTESGVDWDTSVRAAQALGKHLEKIRRADTRYPILLAADGSVIDGVHRIVRASLDGAGTIPARRVETIPEDACIT